MQSGAAVFGAAAPAGFGFNLTWLRPPACSGKPSATGTSHFALDSVANDYEKMTDQQRSGREELNYENSFHKTPSYNT